MLAGDLKIGDKIYVVINDAFNIGEVREIERHKFSLRIRFNWIITPSGYNKYSYLYRLIDSDVESINPKQCVTTDLDEALKFLDKQIKLIENK